ncbi:hypothetical protein MP228_011345 [Amoeboaphelidium protococcarum]|nr:hypothetical protein MP228_011345 [Amoeboaphelidium protococcarum]
MDGEKQNKIQALVEVSGLSRSEAEHLLEAHQWNVDEAVTTHYDTGLKQPQIASTIQRGSSSQSQAPVSDSSGRRGIATFSDLQQSGGGGQGQGGKDDKEKQTYFTGGEKSGMLVEGPPQDSGSGSNDVVQQLLKKAQQMAGFGPSEGDDDEDEDEGSYQSRMPQQSALSRPVFKGTGYKLGGEDVQSEVIPDPSYPQVPGQSGLNQHQQQQGHELPEVERRITFWKDGFTIGEDGELLKYDDPKNKQILELILSGRAPLHLFNVQPGQRAVVKVEEKRDQMYVPPKRSVKAFSGTGNRLGSVVPQDSSQQSSSQQKAPTQQSSSSSFTLKIDDAKPVTSIQIRLADGTRMVARFNLTHTVADVRNFINNSRPGQGGRSYSLQTQFPTKVLEDAQSLGDAGLNNAVIFQKMQ